MGEFAKWGPCTGEQLNCGVVDSGTGTGGGGTEDSGGHGTGGGGSEDSGGGCQCIPGAIIWCDADCIDNIYCSFTAQKTCQPNGSWGPCTETMQQMPASACKHVGLGCQGCNGGLGFYTGDCSQALNCGNNPLYCQNLSYSDSGQDNNGQWTGTAMCMCQ
jgi:hypothetical protein